MKKIYLISAFVLTLGLVGCTRTELDPLTGVFPSPTEVTLSQAATVQLDAYKDDLDRRIFDLELSEAGNSLKATLVGDKYFLPANQYTEALDAVAQKGNFILGKTSVNGRAVKQGTITVEMLSQADTEEGCENTYALSTVLFLEDGTPYKVSWTGNLSFIKDAEQTIDGYYTDTVSQPTDASWTPIAGVEKHTLLVVDDAGNTLASAELVIAEGGKLDGEYTCMSYPDKDHFCGNGYDLSAYGWGVGGTYYVSDGAYILVNEGEKISVTDLGSGIYTITYPDGFALTAAPQGYTPGAVTLTTVMSVTNYYEMYSAWGMEIHLIGLELSDGNVSSSYDAATYSTTYSGTGNFLKLEFYTADGKVAPGTYTPCAVAGEVTEGTFGIGYTGNYGPGSGTNWVYSEGGANEYENILDGELTISYADGNFTFTLSSSVVTATYTGPVEGLSVEGEEPDPTPDPDPDPEPGEGVNLSGLWIYDTVGAVLKQDNSVVDGLEKHTMTITDAEGQTVGGMELVIAEGGSLAGTYTCMSYPDEAYKMGNGYSFWGFTGGSYYYSGEEFVPINEGESATVTINDDGSYTFSGEGFSLSGNMAFVATGLVITDVVGAVNKQDNSVVEGLEKHTMTMKDASDNVVAGAELVIAEGGSLVGTYTCMSYPDEAYKMGNGYSFWGFTGGTYYYRSEEFVPVNEGETMIVSQNGDGSYTFTGTGFSVTGTIAAE